MTDINTIETKWHELSIDEGEHVVESDDYYVELSGEEVPTISAMAVGLSFGPKVNTAPSLSFEVPPDERLEGQDYLATTLKFFVGPDLAFQGEVRKVQASRDHENDFSIKARSKGRELTGETDRRTINNEVSYDAIAEEIDEYNDFDGTHDDLVNTSQESLSANADKRGGHVRGVTDGESSATVEYKNVGPDATNIDILYAKLYATDGLSVTVDTASSSYTETFSGQDKNIYGEWVQITPDGSLSAEEYDLTFDFGENDLLHDWITITNHDIKRTVLTPTVTQLEQDIFLYSRFGEDLLEVEEVGNGIWIDEGEEEDEEPQVRTRQITSWNTIELSDGDGTGYSNVRQATGSENSVDNRILQLPRGTTSGDMGPLFDLTNPLEDWAIALRMRVTDEGSGDGSGEHHWDGFLNINGVELQARYLTNNLYSSGSPDSEFTWRARNIEYDANPAFDNPIESIDTFEIGTSDDTSYDAVEIDAIVFIHKERDLIYTLDDTLDSNDQLSRPYQYATSQNYEGELGVTFSPFITTDNISEATVSASIQNTSDAFGRWGPRQSIAFIADYPNPPPNSTTNETDFVYPGVSHKVNIVLSGSGTQNYDSPTKSVNPMIIEDFSVTGSLNDLSVIYDYSVSDNRLSVINDIATKTASVFRFSGDEATIFQPGLLKTDPDLHREDIYSSVSIEDVYASCEVFGANNISSGVVKAENPPDFVDDHKEIRDQELESVEACVREAVDFLRENSTVQYEGEIETLPTFAPLGEEMNGSMFPHGQDMLINSVRYGMRGATIRLGKKKDLSSKLINMRRRSESSDKKRTRKGFRVPVGEDEFSE